MVSAVSITNTPLARSSSTSGPDSSRRERSTSSPRSVSARATSAYSVGSLSMPAVFTMGTRGPRAGSSEAGQSKSSLSQLSLRFLR